MQISWAIAPVAFELCAVTEQPAAKSMDTEMQDAPARPAPLIVGRPSLKRPLSSDGVGSLPSKLYAATIDGSPAPSPRRREVSLAGAKRSRSGEDEAQARRRQFAAVPLPAPVAPLRGEAGGDRMAAVPAVAELAPPMASFDADDGGCGEPRPLAPLPNTKPPALR